MTINDSFSRDDANPLAGNWQPFNGADYATIRGLPAFNDAPVSCAVCSCAFVADDVVHGECSGGGPMVWRHMGCEPKA